MLRRLWERWTRVAHSIGTFQSRVLLTLFYGLILAPFALGVRLLADPLRLRRQNRAHWLRHEDNPTPSGNGARRQF
jgi:hypothetical protein